MDRDTADVLSLAVRLHQRPAGEPCTVHTECNGSPLSVSAYRLGAYGVHLSTHS